MAMGRSRMDLSKLRIGRTEFVTGLLILNAIGIVLGLIIKPNVLVGVILLVPFLAAEIWLATMRLRDMGYSESLALLTFVPVANIVLLVMLLCRPGDEDRRRRMAGMSRRGSHMPEGKMLCPGCGRVTSTDKEQCSFCGKHLKATQQSGDWW